MRKNKKIQIRLDQDTAELLNSLSLRFNDSKTGIIIKALKCLAAKNNHIMTVRYRESIESHLGVSMEEATKIAKTKWLDK